MWKHMAFIYFARKFGDKYGKKLNGTAQRILLENHQKVINDIRLI